MSAPPRVAVLGAINLDLTARTPRMPAPGETVADGTLYRGSGGKGANQAAAAARLGATTRFFGAVGDDPDGAALTHELAESGVDTTGVQVVSTPTGVALIVVDDTGENSIVVCPGANQAISPAGVRLASGEALLTQLEIPVGVVEDVVARADGFVALNLSPAMPIPGILAARVDLFIVNETEYAAVPPVAGDTLIAVTLGSRGAALIRQGAEIARAHSPAAQVVNTVGAGDSFAAALTLGLLQGDAPSLALAQACAVGAAAVASPLSRPPLTRLADYRPAT